MNRNVESSEVTMTKQSTYASFEALEEEIAHCYFVFHERFIGNLRLAKFWAEAALDEMQHASILRFCREHQLFAALDPADKAADKIDQLLDTVRDAVSRPRLTPDEAFSAALVIESSELDESYQKLAHPLAHAHFILYQAIQANLRLHHYNFAEAAAEFCKDKTFAEAFRALARSDKRTFAERGR
jgi:hypothetical protein